MADYWESDRFEVTDGQGNFMWIVELREKTVNPSAADSDATDPVELPTYRTLEDEPVNLTSDGTFQPESCGGTWRRLTDEETAHRDTSKG